MNQTMQVLLKQVIDRTDPERLAQTQHSLRLAVQDHFRDLVSGSGGELTPEILAEADRLYDAPGSLVDAIADGLGLTPNELRRTLGKDEQIVCHSCGDTFTVFRRRKKEGYSEPNRTCPRCRRAERREVNEQFEALREAEEFRARIDREILASSDPLSHSTLRRHLQRYAELWASGKAYQECPISQLRARLGPGCMVCGQEPAFMLIAREEPAADSGFWHVARAYEDLTYSLGDGPGEVSWSRLATFYQELWRLDPDEYFAEMPHFPLNQMAVVFLCAQHRPLVEDTHVILAQV